MQERRAEKDPMDQLDAMRVFLALADAGSFSAAARALGVPVPSVSRKLQALEGHLEAKLVSRTTRSMALTEAGRRYLEASRRIVADVEASDAALTCTDADMHGALAVTAPIAFGRRHVLPVVAEYLRAHPGMDMRLTLSDRLVGMIDEGIDVAIRIASLPDSSLYATRVGDVRTITCASPEYLAARGVPKRPDDLAAHDCILAGHAPPTRWSFPSRGGRRSVGVRARLVVTTAEAAVDAAIEGLGVARVLSYQAADAIDSGRLELVLEGYEPPAVPVSVVHGEGRTPRPRVRAFVSLAARRLREALRTRGGAGRNPAAEDRTSNPASIPA
jgi:DNA-binding transcriptional LysR family regulator